MKRLVILAALAAAASPVIAAGSASADEVTIRTRSDSGLHRGWSHAPAYGARKVVVKRTYNPDATGSTRITKKVTKTNAYGDRVTKKVTREVD